MSDKPSMKSVKEGPSRERRRALGGVSTSRSPRASDDKLVDTNKLVEDLERMTKQANAATLAAAQRDTDTSEGLSWKRTTDKLGQAM